MNQESGHGLRVRVVMSRSDDEVIDRAEADLEGRFEFKYGGLPEPGSRVNLSVSPTIPDGGVDLITTIASQDVVALGTPDRRELNFEIASADKVVTTADRGSTADHMGGQR